VFIVLFSILYLFRGLVYLNVLVKKCFVNYYCFLYKEKVFSSPYTLLNPNFNQSMSVYIYSRYSIFTTTTTLRSGVELGRGM
jgi:hypothetical protein